MTLTAWLGIVFAALAIVNTLLMMHAWGYPFDEKRGISSAPRWMVHLHRAIGFAFLAVYVYMMSRMVPRLWTYQEPLDAVAAGHALLGVAIGAVLATKILIVRFFPAFRPYLPLFGITLLLLTVTSVTLPISMRVRESRLYRAALHQATIRAVAPVVDIQTDDGMKLPLADALRAGRRAFLTRCHQCHGAHRVLARTRTPDTWSRTVTRMAGRLGDEGSSPIDEREQQLIVAYLTAIRGRPAPAPMPAERPPAVAEEPPAQPAGEQTATAPRPVPQLGTMEVGGSAAARPGPSHASLGARVQELFRDRCVVCHQGADAPRGLRLDSLEGALAAGVVIAGDVQGSELLRRVRGESVPRMPMTGPPWLSAEQIALLEDWVRSLDGEAKLYQQPADAPTADPPPPGSPVPVALRQADPVENPVEPPPMPGAGEPVTFAHVAPILLRNCVKCHTADGLMGPAPKGLLLGTYENVLGSAERPVVLPGLPAASALLRRVHGRETPRMPFDGPPWLSDEDVSAIERWVRDGARDERGRPAATPVGAEVRMTGTLESRWVVDGVRFLVTGETRVRDAAVGSIVELRATVSAGGTLVAQRVRGR